MILTLFYVTLLVLTTFIWGFIFYKKDYHPQPMRVIRQTFLLGLLGMVPVFIYKYVYQHFLPQLSAFQLFKPLLDSPFLVGFATFLFNLFFLSFLLFILSGIVSLLIGFFNHSILINLKSAIKDEPFGFFVVSILLGLVIYFESLAQNFFATSVIGTALGTILFLGIIEEYVKHLMVRITDDKKLRDIDDAITLSIVVGLAFALIETLIYAFMVGDVSFIFYRMLITTPVHLVASGVFGYYYGLAHFAKPIVQLEEGKDRLVRHPWLPAFLRLRRSTIYHEKRMIQGILFATIFHASMNLLFEFSLGFIAVPLVIIGVMVLFKLYKEARREDRLIAGQLQL